MPVSNDRLTAVQVGTTFMVVTLAGAPKKAVTLCAITPANVVQVQTVVLPSGRPPGHGSHGHVVFAHA